MWVEHKICSTICGTPVPTILNYEKSTGGAREGQNMAHLGHINGPCTNAFEIKLAIDIQCYKKWLSCPLLVEPW